ncbi:MAG: ABC transporter permease [Polyangia bacterium]|jgi:molybdate/tungstate transport system permease protein|nr:ABC transporter permease [Polyangia bacterium]
MSQDAPAPLPAARGRSWVFHLALALAGSLVVLLVVAPILGMLVASSFGELSSAARDRQVLESLRVTLVSAFWATIVCTLAGVPLAWLLARRRFRGRSLLLALLDLPIVVPHVAAGVALLTVVGRHSLLGKLTGGGLVGTTAGISMAMAFVSVPFLLNSARQGFEAIPLRVEQAARTLGASPRQVFFIVALPLAWRSILTGMTLMWARGISEFGAVVIIAYHPMTTPVLVYQRLNDHGLGYARAAAVLLVLVCVALFVGLRLLSRPPRTGHRGRDA